MNCDECKNLISVFMDNELEKSRAVAVRMHLAVCPDCARVCEDFASILDVCTTESPSELVPPNSQALWCRINNIIENEVKGIAPVAEKPRGRFWQLSFVQVTAAVLGIAIISSLLTVVAIKNYVQPVAVDFTTRSAVTQTTFEKILSRVGLMETPQQSRDRREKEQQAAIDYWNTRVQTRRVQWDRTTRDAFDRNLQAIDESVNDYSMILQQDPEDELSGEMLDSVLNDKMNLLRDFSDL
ncbi:MAG: zf-HC2 domain-containing protein [Pyrinomonadaceae bacterium]